MSRNNFDLLRAIFATIVCLFHTASLSGYQGINWLEVNLSSSAAVRAFFIVSGFLIFMSYERAASVASYASKRIRRIYPAYFTIVMVCAIFLVLASSRSAAEYFSFSWLKYVAANLSFLNFLQPSLPGVFESNKYTAVNGALWTLKIEAMFYVTVPLLVFLFRKFSRLPIIALVYAASVTYAFGFQWLAEATGSAMYAEIGRQFPGQLSYFIAGAFFYYFLSIFEKRVVFFLVGALIILGINMIFPLPFFEPFALGAVIVFFGLFGYLGNFGKYGDFSYGIYIVHFPIVQLLCQYGIFREEPWYFLVSAVILTGISSVLMWHLVEKRFLLRSSHYISTSKTGSAALPSFPDIADQKAEQDLS